MSAVVDKTLAKVLTLAGVVVALLNAQPMVAFAQVLPPGALPDNVTVASLMRDTINPSSRAIWRAVSYTVTAEGTTETAPTTDADWQALRTEAESLLRAATLLMLPTLTVGDMQAAADRPGFQYTPAEIERLRVQQTDAWRSYAQQLQTTTLQVLKTIEQRDVNAYVEAGPPINQACEGCHGQFWYRPPNMNGALGR